MIADIKPQWKQLANWWWDSGENLDMSIWEMLEHEYGARQLPRGNGDNLVEFPDDGSYVLFVLRWS